LIARWSTASGGWVVSATSGALGDAARSLVIDGGGALMAGTGIGWYGATLVRESAISGYGWDRVGSGLTRARRTAWISALSRLPDGRVAVGGAFDATGATILQNLALWDPTRQSLTSIGSGLPAAPDALASSAHSLAYAAIRLRSAEPGGSGRPCITAWAGPAPARPAAPTLVARRTQITVQWNAAASGGAPAGWIAEARARGHDTRTCVAVAPELTCAITGLDPGTKYSVQLRAYAIPAGPSAASLAAKVTTKR
jgi:hypothetical protein